MNPDVEAICDHFELSKVFVGERLTMVPCTSDKVAVTGHLVRAVFASALTALGSDAMTETASIIRLKAVGKRLEIHASAELSEKCIVAFIHAWTIFVLADCCLTDIIVVSTTQGAQ